MTTEQKPTRECEGCGEIFEIPAGFPDQRFHNRECSLEHQARPRRGVRTITREQLETAIAGGARGSRALAAAIGGVSHATVAKRLKDPDVEDLAARLAG